MTPLPVVQLRSSPSSVGKSVKLSTTGRQGVVGREENDEMNWPRDHRRRDRRDHSQIGDFEMNPRSIAINWWSTEVFYMRLMATGMDGGGLFFFFHVSNDWSFSDYGSCSIARETNGRQSEPVRRFSGVAVTCIGNRQGKAACPFGQSVSHKVWLSGLSASSTATVSLSYKIKLY